MPWTSHSFRLPAGLALFTLLVCVLLGALPSAEERQISVYAPRLSYSLPILQRNGGDYVGLLEALEPLGSVSARLDGDTWKLRFNGAQSEFKLGKNKGKVRGKTVRMPGRLLVENNRGLVPLRALANILSAFLQTRVVWHEAGLRFFVGNVGTRFTTELQKDALVFNFTAPVNPVIATEPGKLRMTFTRDPVLYGGEPLKFESPLVSSVSFAEGNGRAELTVDAHVPLLATFANDGRTINIAAAPGPQQPAAAATPPADLTSAAPQPPVAPPPPRPTISLAALTAKPPFLVFVDAGHGGDDRGAALSDKLNEKDVTLAFARLVRNALQNRGIYTLMARDSDATLSADQRATLANKDRAAVYLSLHAGSLGRGVRVYTSMLAPAERQPFTSWDTAQAGYADLSRALATAIKTELDKRQLAAAVLQVALRPLNHIAGAALAIEIAPSGPQVESVAAWQYQQSVASAVAEAVASARARLEAER